MSTQDGRKKKSSAGVGGKVKAADGKAKAPKRTQTPITEATGRSDAPDVSGSGTAANGTGSGTAKKAAATGAAKGSSSGASARGGRRGAKLDAKALASIKARLLAERTDLMRRQTELEQDSFDGSQSDMTGEVGLDEDYAESGTATFDRERDLSIRNNIQDLIDQADRALERIDAGTYGTCERCGRPIEAARLKALHHAVLCLDCKRREERAR